MRRLLPPLLLIILVGFLIWTAPINRCDDDACRVGVAVASGNSHLCSALSTEATRAWCYRDVAVAALDVQACEGISAAEAAEHCRADVAAAGDDLEGCQALAGGARDSCLDAIARSRQTGTLCGSIAAPAFRDACAYDVGLATSSADSCLAMVDTDRSYRCVTFVAMAQNSTAVCARIPQPDKDWCVASVAMKLGDVAICDEITATDVFSACLLEIQKGR